MLVYCDFIADRIRSGLESVSRDFTQPVSLVEVGRVRFNLNTDGSFRSTKKTLSVVDKNGRRYRVTVEEELN